MVKLSLWVIIRSNSIGKSVIERSEEKLYIVTIQWEMPIIFM